MLGLVEARESLTTRSGERDLVDRHAFLEDVALVRVAGVDDELVAASFMPGANENLDMFAKRHGVPLAAALGGVATLYPEYVQRLREGGDLQPSAVRPAQRAATTAPRAEKPADAEVGSLHVAGQVWLTAAGGPQRRRAGGS